MTPTRYRYVVLAFLAAAAAVAYLGRNGMVAAEKTIRDDVRLTEDEMGFLLGPAFFWPYALFQLPLGWVGQRLGPRVWLPTLMLVTASATAVFGLGGGFVVLLISRVVNGTAQAGLFPGCTQTISKWYPTRERALATGVLGSFMSVGGAAGMALTGWLQGPVGWQTLSYWYAVPGFLWAVGFWVLVRDTPAEHPRVNAAERDLIAAGRPPTSTSSAAAGGVALALALSPALWLICGQQFFRASAYAFFQSWFPTFLAASRGISTEEAGGLSALPLIGTVFGMLSGGVTSDWVYRKTGSLSHARRTLSILAAAAAGTTVLAAFFVRDPVAAVLVISCGAFLSGMAGPLAYAVTIDMGGRAVATVFAAMNTAGNVGAGLLPWVVPAFRRALESNPAVLELCGGNGWNGVLFLFSALYFLSAACWMLLRVRGTVLDASLIRVPGGGDGHDVR